MLLSVGQEAPFVESVSQARAVALVPRVDVAIVGSGFSGLCMAIELKRAGITDFVLFERAKRLGGTWRDNTYPGCACDIPSHLYSYSFEPNPTWSRVYAPHDEILAYLERVAAKYGVLGHVKLEHELEEAVFDRREGRWNLRMSGGRRYSARFLIGGLGPLSNPYVPSVPGLDRFEGRAMHSAAWDHSFDFRKKRVAVVGTGASSIQIVPQLQKKVASLHLFQRTPAWILPKKNRAFSPLEKLALAHLPLARRSYRQAIYLWHELKGLAFFRPDMIESVREANAKLMAESISDPAFRHRLTPSYAPGCKRILLSDDFYPALAQPNVEVLDGGIVEVREKAVVGKDGREIPVDAIVWGTGFRVQEHIGKTRVVGRDGVGLHDLWRDRGPRAYLGTSIHGFPNLFLILGPNSGLSYNSMVLMIEAQARYVRRAVEKLSTSGGSSIEVTAEAEARWNDEVARRSAQWMSGKSCESWYFDEKGRNTTLWPGSTVAFRWKTLRFDPRDYRIT